MTVSNKISCLLGVFALLLASTPGTAKQLNGFEIRDPLVPMKLIKSGGPPRDGIPAGGGIIFLEKCQIGTR